MHEGRIVGGKYRITELIGKGGIGTVFEAVHLVTGARVALKMIVSEHVQPEMLVRLEREARAAAALESIHIVRMYDVGRDAEEGCPYLVMERLHGDDLAEATRHTGALDPMLVVSLVMQALAGLAKAHAAGVVHRDIKPANIFLHEDFDRGHIVVKLLDFGLAKFRMALLGATANENENENVTRVGSILGSPHYMSPEQAQGLATIDARTDLWSVGVLMYKLLTGHLPHAHMQALGPLLSMICSQPARPLRELAPWVPEPLARVVHRAVQIDPKDRFQTADDMLAALSALGVSLAKPRREDLVPYAPPGTTITAAAPNDDDGAAHPSEGARVRWRRRPALIAAIAAAGTFTLATAAAFAVRAGAPAPPASAAARDARPERLDAPTRHVTSIKIEPPDAEVHVGSRRYRPRAGALAIAGPVGGTLRLRVSKGDAEVVAQVTITEHGPTPAAIVLPVSRAHAANKATPRR